MKKILTGILILAVIALFLTGCSKKTEVTTQKTEVATQPAVEPAAEIDTEAEIGAGAEGMEQLEEDLDSSDLDDIEKDLAEIDW